MLYSSRDRWMRATHDDEHRSQLYVGTDLRKESEIMATKRKAAPKRKPAAKKKAAPKRKPAAKRKAAPKRKSAAKRKK